ncbi:NAD-dependent epimerase/dehydratase family protein [soil metagenome]
MRVLVTGAAGFIGSHVVDALVSSGCDVVATDGFHRAAHAREPDYLNPAADWRRADLRDGDAMEAAATGVDAVSHQAAMVGLGTSFEDAPDFVAHNDLGTAMLLRALHATGFDGRLVLASSMVVYGEGGYECRAHGAVRPAARSPARLERGCFEPECPSCGLELAPIPVTEGLRTDPRNVYAATKLHQEHLCAAFGRETGAAVASLRYHNVYGPRMPRDTPYAGVASVFRSALEEGSAPQVFEDGRQLRDFVHVSDVAAANVAALESDRGVVGPFNIASGRPRSVGDMAAALARSLGPSAPAPEVTGGFRLGDVRHVFASPRRAWTTLGWRAEVSFEDGMSELAYAPLRAAVPRSS